MAQKARGTIMLRLDPHWWRKPPAILSYAVAFLSPACAIIVESWLQSGATVSLFLCAIILSAWFGGIGPGLTATAVSILGFRYFFMPPTYSFAVDAAHVPRLALFVLVSLFVGSLTAAQRSTAASLRNARDDLQKKNRALQAENIERKHHEEKLREQAQLLDLTHDTIFVRDMNDVITYWNRGAEEQYGWKEVEALGRVSHQLTQTVFPAPLDEINAELLRTGRWEGELIHARRDGTRVVVASRWSLQKGGQGDPIAILETNNDITERRRFEDALRGAQVELAHVTRLTTLGELTASIAHEVNQPLAAIITNGDACLRWLDRDVPQLDEVRNAVQLVINDGNRAADVIRRVRALSKKTDAPRAPLPLNEIIDEVILLLQREVLSHQALLRRELASELPLVLVDRVQIQQVIINLMMNGMEAMAAVTGRPRELKIQSQRDGADQVLVAVQDSGLGIEPEHMDRLFNAFFTTKPTGMGMGLSICRSIIDAHGGRLSASNHVDGGAIFQFTLPAYRDQAS
jgi:PAS domain S-box-containing protein